MSKQDVHWSTQPGREPTRHLVNFVTWPAVSKEDAAARDRALAELDRRGMRMVNVRGLWRVRR